MIYYNDIAITALRLEELETLLKDKEALDTQIKEALKEGHKKFNRDFEKLLIVLMGDIDNIPESNMNLINEYVINSTKLILPPKM